MRHYVIYSKTSNHIPYFDQRNFPYQQTRPAPKTLMMSLFFQDIHVSTWNAICTTFGFSETQHSIRRFAYNFPTTYTRLLILFFPLSCELLLILCDLTLSAVLQIFGTGVSFMHTLHIIGCIFSRWYVAVPWEECTTYENVQQISNAKTTDEVYSTLRPNRVYYISLSSHRNKR